MSQESDDQELLRTLTREGGRLKWTRLTYRGIKAANRLIKRQQVYVDQHADEGWDLVLAPSIPGARS